MKKYWLKALILVGLFYFSEGKPCPERTKSHKTRCDVYFKCTEITADKHVWVPTRCEEGLIYEHSLAVCVLPADDWECLMGEQRSNADLKQKIEPQQSKPSNNKDSDIYIVSNAEDEDGSLNSKYDDEKVEIIIGAGLSSEDKSVESDDQLYDGSGNGGEMVELDGFMPAQNRETEDNDEEVPIIKSGEKLNKNKNANDDQDKLQKKEELEEMLQTIKTKAEMGEPSTNIDPKLTAHLQRLSQLIDGLKQTYHAPEVKPQEDQSLRPDQLNAFLAHFNIKNKFDTLEPSEEATTASSFATSAKVNKSSTFKHEFSTKLSPETKVVLSSMLPHRYGSGNQDNGHAGSGYSNSQIVINRPEGSVLFRLPSEHHFVEHPDYSSDNTPKISEETLKTVLELSKQMISQQNVPKVIPNPTYFASQLMQPILLTPNVDSPFSSNYIPQNTNNLGFLGQFENNPYFNPNNNYKKPGKRPQSNGGSSNNGYGNDKPATTIIHNNVIPVHLSNTNSGDKEVLDSYGHSLGLYPPHHDDRPDMALPYSAETNSDFQSNGYTGLTTKRPSYGSISTTPRSYENSVGLNNYRPTASALNQYFTPSEHLSEHNVNNVFSNVDNFGSIPRPLKSQRPNLQFYKPSQQNIENEGGYGSPNLLFPQIDSQKVHGHPNAQNFESMENDNDDNNYSDDNNEDESQLITYSYGNRKKTTQHSSFPNYGDSDSVFSSNIKKMGQSQFSNYGDSDDQLALNSVFSSNNNYMPRPPTNNLNSLASSNSYNSPGKKKYTASSSPITSSYGEGTQLVNMGGNFISFDVFQNSILPLVGNNPASLSSSLNNVEVITCAAGVRQPNTTDCTRYYVCSKKDGKVLSYSCPPYTAFNGDARICDAKTYALCNPDSAAPHYSVSENKRIQMETLKALQEAKRRQQLQQQQQQQLIKAQNLANMLQQFNSPANSLNNGQNSLSHTSGPDSSEQNMLNSYMQQAASMSQTFSTTSRPHVSTSSGKKRKYYCKEGDKIADQTSIYNYFVCYKNAEGQMKGHKMTCSKSLLFCPKTTMCTLPSKCS